MIAAAPNMLAVLKRLHRALRWTCTADRMAHDEMEDLIRDTLEKIGETE